MKTRVVHYICYIISDFHLYYIIHQINLYTASDLKIICDIYFLKKTYIYIYIYMIVYDIILCIIYIHCIIIDHTKIYCIIS